MPRLESFLRFDCLLRMRGLGRCLKLFSQKILILPPASLIIQNDAFFRWTLKLIPDSENINKSNPDNADDFQIL